MKVRTLTLRELNRATLARQMLLQRAVLTAAEAIEHLAGLQAQLPVAPYVGLWTRVRAFKRAELARAIEKREVVKVTLMRGTLHLCTADDYLALRPPLMPVLEQASESIAKRRGEELSRETILDAARAYIGEEPRTFAEISSMLEELTPGTDVGAMRYMVRTNLPLVQVPVEGGWSYPARPRFALAESWLGRPVGEEGGEEGLRGLIFRYLSAFGPASVTDVQTWSGLGKLKEAFEKLRPDLVIYRDEQNRELFDIPGGPILPEDAPAPERFLPEYDNILLSHSKRTRIVADEHKPGVYLPGLRVAATFLVDGFVGGVWRIEEARGTATLVIESFGKLTKSSRDALAEEGEGLVRFVESEATNYEVRFAE